MRIYLLLRNYILANYGKQIIVRGENNIVEIYTLLEFPKYRRENIQPFFTTKPTGQCAGLGLSLAYDIIEAHAGDIKIESKDGDGSVFTIYLPLPSN